jgi:hypothetical protein
VVGHSTAAEAATFDRARSPELTRARKGAKSGEIRVKARCEYRWAPRNEGST